jgi:hypothetical protein
MKWTNECINEIINLLQLGKTYFEVSKIIGRSENSIRVKMGRIGETYSKYNDKKLRMCINCGCEIFKFGKVFCSNSCSATFNNKLRTKKNISKNDKINKRKRHEYHLRKVKKCINCDNITTHKFCNSKCLNEYNQKQKFKLIENGDITLDFRQYKKYLINKHGNKCMVCGWCKINQHSGKIPIELEHIDGNSNNNSLSNLKLLCPNCHSLTSTYKSLNTGNGRHKRRERYNEGKSY